MRSVVGMLTVATVLLSAQAALAVELEANVLNGCGGGLGVGLPLGERTVLVLSAAGTYGDGTWDQARSESVYVSLPLDLKIYLRRPRAGAIAPTARLGVVYAYQRESWTEPATATARAEWHLLGARGLLGAEYLVTSRLGINAEIGVLGVKAVGSGSSPAYRGGYRTVGLTWLAGLVLHL